MPQSILVDTTSPGRAAPKSLDHLWHQQRQSPQPDFEGRGGSRTPSEALHHHQSPLRRSLREDRYDKGKKAHDRIRNPLSRCIVDNWVPGSL